MINKSSTVYKELNEFISCQLLALVQLVTQFLTLFPSSGRPNAVYNQALLLKVAPAFSQVFPAWC